MNGFCISNLVYGKSYTDIFLDYHLKSIVENFTRNKSDEKSHYLIFTTEENIETIQAHKNFALLKELFLVKFISIQGNLTYDMRYQVQGAQVQYTAKFALENNLLLHIACADVYYGENLFKDAAAIINRGYDSVINQPMRAAYESSAPHLGGRVLTTDELFEVGFNNQHPLWTSSNWDSPYFSQIPYQIIWTDEKSICLRGFSLSAQIVVPKEWMLSSGGCTDISFMPHLKNPYYSSDWSELPMIELQHLFSFYPPFRNKRALIADVASWAKKSVLPENIGNLRKYITYKKTTDVIDPKLISESEKIAEQIIHYIK